MNHEFTPEELNELRRKSRRMKCLALKMEHLADDLERAIKACVKAQMPTTDAGITPSEPSPSGDGLPAGR